MSRVPVDIRCMLIPLHDQRLLVPNGAVAEIIGYREPDALAEAGKGIQGTVNWRQRELPVIDFERLMGAADRPPGIRQRIAVCYAPDPESRWPLIGLVSQGIPRLLRLARDTIVEATAGPHGMSPIQMRIDIGDERLIVPDLVQLQAHVAETGAVRQSRKSPQSA